MYLIRQKVTDHQFHMFAHRLWLELAKISSIDELRKYKLSIRTLYGQASTDERLHLTEKLSAEYRYLYVKFINQKPR